MTDLERLLRRRVYSAGEVEAGEGHTASMGLCGRREGGDNCSIWRSLGARTLIKIKRRSDRQDMGHKLTSPHPSKASPRRFCVSNGAGCCSAPKGAASDLSTGIPVDDESPLAKVDHVRGQFSKTSQGNGVSDQ